jgi:serine/threonine protein kinase
MPQHNLSLADKILSMMGEGTFGRVLECWDRKTKVTVAIKVIRSVPKYREAAMIEVCFPQACITLLIGRSCTYSNRQYAPRRLNCNLL